MPVITHDISVAIPESSNLLRQQQVAELRRLRHKLHLQYRPILQQGAGPIRVMARMVADLERQCRALNIPEEIIQAEIVNRTIGDINLRRVTECVGEEGGATDYRMLAEEVGVALPGEDIHGYIAPGTTYLWLHDQTIDLERQLLAEHFDLRIYDILAIGNPLLRAALAREMQGWGLSVTQHNVYLGLGAMDSLNKVFCGLIQMFREQGITDVAALFPTPGFATPEWQARSYGYQMIHLPTLPEHHFKLTAAQLEQIITENPAIRVIYLTVTNNPTAFAYSPDELNAIHSVLRTFREKGREIYILADLAYIGTGKPEEDQARMATFIPDDVQRHIIFVSSFSKTMTLTGERFGWVTCGDAALAAAIAPGWSNSMASLPAEWQLRFMAYMRLMESRPWLIEKLRAFYRLRRQRFIAQLHSINEQQPLFEEIYSDDDATVYNWSKLLPGEDAFTLFEKTGIAGVPGSGFGYSDEYIRFSIGVIPVPEASEL
ncbi:MAG TPA: pyridoxal phosphate-dependent aminotransferase [Ktedonobacteraceae bacterium]|nr:pyridoxal phosphate-dependent aminotransferase [Ktedonobacteraceae bacterium]